AEHDDKKLSLIDILFYLSGLLVYGALMVSAFQLPSDSEVARALLMLVAGLAFWTCAFLLGRQSQQNDVRKGLVNSLILTGSLGVSTGGFLTAVVVAPGGGQAMTFAVAADMVVLGLFNLAFDRVFRHIVLIIFGVLLLVAAFPAAVVAFLQGLDTNVDVWATVGILTGFFTAYAGLLASRSASGREGLRESFDSFAGFIVLGSIYAACFSPDLAVFWEIVLPITIYLAFFLSIKRRSKNFLVTGSFFLVLFLITISFKYFSGLGVSFCLILSAVSLVASALVATNINKRYIKQ
ncbi:MAG: hypothetical protein ACREGB_02645, partial [Candidatus Saccharimonadales bacterium]